MDAIRTIIRAWVRRQLARKDFPPRKPAPPADPYADAQAVYERQQRRLWSTGEIKRNRRESW